MNAMTASTFKIRYFLFKLPITLRSYVSRKRLQEMNSRQA